MSASSSTRGWCSASLLVAVFAVASIVFPGSSDFRAPFIAETVARRRGLGDGEDKRVNSKNRGATPAFRGEADIGTASELLGSTALTLDLHQSFCASPNRK